jgi:hypothetical protein
MNGLRGLALMLCLEPKRQHRLCVGPLTFATSYGRTSRKVDLRTVGSCVLKMQPHLICDGGVRNPLPKSANSGRSRAAGLAAEVLAEVFARTICLPKRAIEAKWYSGPQVNIRAAV